MSLTEATPAIFGLETFAFQKVNIDFSSIIGDKNSLNIGFEPKGSFESGSDLFMFNLEIEIKNKENHFIKTDIDALFKFEQPLNSKDDIPPYFYSNSIAIVYPYLRSFISSISLQAGHESLILPTLNLGALAQPFEKNTTEISK